MARRTQTYAIRLAVEGGGQVKAELISVGQSGEQSLKRIESAGERASGGLMGLGRQAELLRTGIRTLGGALIGVTTVGGLAAHPGRPPWCGAGTPIRSASCAHGTTCLRFWGVRHLLCPPRPAPAWSSASWGSVE
jgi:hypothetical protein